MTDFVSEVNKQLERLKALSLGARDIPVTVSNFKSSRLPDADGAAIADIFDVTINISSGSKTWQILFDFDNPSFCPDIILNEDEDNFLPDIASLKSFADWDCSSANALAELVTDLYTAYSSHQRSRLLKYPQLCEQMEQLLSTTQYGSICEVDIQKKGPGTFNDTIKLLIPINVDYSNLPPYVEMKSPGKNGCRLCISYEPPNLTKVTPTLELSLGVQNAFSKVTNLRIPSFSKSPLSVYVNRIHALVENTVNEISESYKRRESFVFSLLSEFNDSILEYDGVTFYESTFLLEIDGFYFILFVILNAKFPTERPTLYLQSIYSMDSSSDIYRATVHGFPYHSQWDDNIMIYHMKKVIADNIEKFQEKSLPNK